MDVVRPRGRAGSGSRRRLAALVVACGLAAFGGDARASAWNQKAGAGFLDVDVTLDAGNRYFDKSGRLLPASAYRNVEAGGYIEYGITDWLMAVVRPSVDDTKVGAPGAGRYFGPGETQAGLQYQLLVFGPAVLAVQGSFRLPGTTSHQSPATVGDTAREGDFRGLAGVGFPIGSFQAFADLQVAYRVRSDGGASQWHGDATLGVRLTPTLLLLLQSFNQVPIGDGTAYLPSATYSDLRVSLVKEITATWSVKAGAYETVIGRNALRERGLVLGVWHRF